MWKYNKEKHSVDEQNNFPFEFKMGDFSGADADEKYNQRLAEMENRIATIRSIPVSGKVDWKDGEDVTGKFTFLKGWGDKWFAIPINIQEQPQYPSKDNGYNRGLGKGFHEFTDKENQSQEQQPVLDKDIELPDILIKYLTESFKEAAEVYGKIKRTASYGGSAFVIFEDDKCYRLNFQSYNDEVSMDEAALNKKGTK